ncbi:unnamed protein product [Amoebophrya sp. A120]|nr:unnamed protein product [Amoebophrya sp. A120]|eukprot:GSA120T00019815001.1
MGNYGSKKKRASATTTPASAQECGPEQIDNGSASSCKNKTKKQPAPTTMADRIFHPAVPRKMSREDDVVSPEAQNLLLIEPGGVPKNEPRKQNKLGGSTTVTEQPPDQEKSNASSNTNSKGANRSSSSGTSYEVDASILQQQQIMTNAKHQKSSSSSSKAGNKDSAGALTSFQQQSVEKLFMHGSILSPKPSGIRTPPKTSLVFSGTSTGGANSSSGSSSSAMTTSGGAAPAEEVDQNTDLVYLATGLTEYRIAADGQTVLDKKTGKPIPNCPTLDLLEQQRWMLGGLGNKREKSGSSDYETKTYEVVDGNNNTRRGISSNSSHGDIEWTSTPRTEQEAKEQKIIQEDQQKKRQELRSQFVEQKMLGKLLLSGERTTAGLPLPGLSDTSTVDMDNNLKQTSFVAGAAAAGSAAGAKRITPSGTHSGPLVAGGGTASLSSNIHSATPSTEFRGRLPANADEFLRRSTDMLSRVKNAETAVDPFDQLGPQGNLQQSTAKQKNQMKIREMRGQRRTFANHSYVTGTQPSHRGTFANHNPESVAEQRDSSPQLGQPKRIRATFQRAQTFHATADDSQMNAQAKQHFAESTAQWRAKFLRQSSQNMTAVLTEKPGHMWSATDVFDKSSPDVVSSSSRGAGGDMEASDAGSFTENGVEKYEDGPAPRMSFRGPSGTLQSLETSSIPENEQFEENTSASEDDKENMIPKATRRGGTADSLWGR